MSFKLVLVVLVATVAASQAGLLNLLPRPCHDLLNPGNDKFTLGCIVTHLCGSSFLSSDATAKVTGFAACYDEEGGEGKEQFFGCMQGAMEGRVLNTVDSVKWTCEHITKMAGYAKCLPGAFEAAGLDLNKTVTRVNICQAKALGLGKQ